MNLSPDTGLLPLESVRLEITARDIAEMEYHFNECPMSNPAHDNAVSLALQRLLKPGIRVSVRVAHGQVVARLGRVDCPLGPEIGAWLGRAVTGCRVGPATFRVALPVALLRSTSEPRSFGVLPSSGSPCVPRTRLSA